MNPYGAEWAIVERKEKGLIEKLALVDAVNNYKTAIETGLLKIMSKMGISVLSSYRGGIILRHLGSHVPSL